MQGEREICVREGEDKGNGGEGRGETDSKRKRGRESNICIVKPPEPIFLITLEMASLHGHGDYR